MTLYVIVIIRVKTEWRNLVTDAKNAVIVIVIVRQDRYKSLLFLLCLSMPIIMTEIELILNDAMALLNIYDADPLRHNDDECRHHIVI